MDTLMFIKGAGVGNTFVDDIENRVTFDKANINKYEIVRTVLSNISISYGSI